MTAYTPFGDAVRVSTSTTHPALAELFTTLFSPYGHIYKHPRHKKDSNTFEWNFQVILDKSFGFLLESRDKCREWVARKESTMLCYLAGFADAEGNIRIYPNPRPTGIIVSIWNTDLELLTFAYKYLKKLEFRPLKPYLHRGPGGLSSGFHIERKKAYWRVLVARFDKAQSLLCRLPLRHSEKIKMKELALLVAKGDVFEKVSDKVSFLKKSIRQEVDQYTEQAELEFLRTHPIESRPVLCLLPHSVQLMDIEEHYGRWLQFARGFLAVHVKDLCVQDEPCVVIRRGCNEKTSFRYSCTNQSITRFYG